MTKFTECMLMFSGRLDMSRNDLNYLVLVCSICFVSMRWHGLDSVDEVHYLE